MQLQRLRVKNFKGLRDQAFEPSGFSCLVGENNAGKSSVLQAVVTALKKPAQLAASQFYDTTQPVEFEFTLVGVDDGHLARVATENREKIAALVVDGALTICLRYALGEKAVLTVMRLVPTDPRYQDDNVAAVFDGKKGAAVADALQEVFPEFAHALQEQPKTATAAKAFLKAQIAQLPAAQQELAERPLPSGIPASITALLPEPIYIPAVKDLNDELKTTQTTSFGRLLGLLLADMTPELQDVDTSLATLNKMLNRIVIDGDVVDQRLNKVQKLEQRVETFLSENFPTAKVQLHIPPPELKSILNSAQIYIDDGARDLVDNKGDGIKRSLTFALLQSYVHHLEQQRAEVGAENAPSPQPLLFLFEEPELYLHPKSQRVLFNTLAKISKTHQVVVTTHSPIFFEPGVTASFIRVAKKLAHPKPEGVLYPVRFDLNPGEAETFRLARFEHADAGFFSRRVVLFEGESDDAYCRHVAKLLDAAWDFEHHNIALLRVSGKGNFKKFRDFFEAFGIEVKVVADLDALFEGFEHLGADEPTTTLRSETLQALDQRIQQLGLVFQPSARQIKKRTQQGSWKANYEAAKGALREIQATKEVADGALALIDSLFTWEQEDLRQQVCVQDAIARAALLPLLDTLRAQGICVLSRGAIEDYYPAGAPANGPKPSRALEACTFLTTREEACSVSQPLAANRRTELEEILESLFA
ncbi:energy-coupling factor transporter ATP-binding protein EcfA2 [Variovorax boronicumulans]|uniref:AAA family ATPase n=1 Tax=Variovorax boronicumulans TaxID=436515 RepID=UPI003393E844